MTPKGQAAITEAENIIRNGGTDAQRMTARVHLSDAMYWGGIMARDLSEGEIDYMSTLHDALGSPDAAAVMDAWRGNRTSWIEEYPGAVAAQAATVADLIGGGAMAGVEALAGLGGVAKKIVEGAGDIVKGGAEGLTNLLKKLPVAVYLVGGVAVMLFVFLRYRKGGK